MDDEDLGQVEGDRELPPPDRDPACGGWPAVGEDGRPDLRRQGGDRGDEEPDTRRSQPDHEPSRGRPRDGRGHRLHVVACFRESLARTGGATSPSWRPAKRRSTSSSPTSCSRSSCCQTSCSPLQLLPDQLLPDQVPLDQLEPDQLLPAQSVPAQLFPAQLLPVQVLPFQRPPCQLLAKPSSLAISAESNGLPKMSCSPLSTTPSRVR